MISSHSIEAPARHFLFLASALYDSYTFYRGLQTSKKALSLLASLALRFVWSIWVARNGRCQWFWYGKWWTNVIWIWEQQTCSLASVIGKGLCSTFKVRFLWMPYFQTNLIHKSDQSLWNPHHRRDHLDVFCVSWIVFFMHPSTTKYHQISILDQWTSWAILYLFALNKSFACGSYACFDTVASMTISLGIVIYIYINNGSAKTSSYSSAQSLSEPFCYAVNSKAHRCTTLQRSLDFLWCRI